MSCFQPKACPRIPRVAPHSPVKLILLQRPPLSPMLSARFLHSSAIHTRCKTSDRVTGFAPTWVCAGHVCIPGAGQSSNARRDQAFLLHPHPPTARREPAASVQARVQASACRHCTDCRVLPAQLLVRATGWRQLACRLQALLAQRASMHAAVQGGLSRRVCLLITCRCVPYACYHTCESCVCATAPVLSRRHYLWRVQMWACSANGGGCMHWRNPRHWPREQRSHCVAAANGVGCHYLIRLGLQWRLADGSHRLLNVNAAVDDSHHVSPEFNSLECSCGAHSRLSMLAPMDSCHSTQHAARWPRGLGEMPAGSLCAPGRKECSAHGTL